ncbi:MAG: CARDB domain-containing protein [Caldilineaceae bacterium]
MCSFALYLLRFLDSFFFENALRNSGTDYAKEIAGLAFNIYIGDDPNPACTYFITTGKCGVPSTAVVTQNLKPDSQPLPFTSAHISISLDQMRAIDLGAPIRIVVQNFTYGADEFFYQDASNAGVNIAIEDGTDDGDENIDTYLIPTWGSETVLTVLARYFPHETDTNGTVTAIWTPEYRSDTPDWCKAPRRPTDQPSKAVWCKHVLSTAEWWNVYTNGLGNGSEGFQDTPAAPGSVALFRFNKDTDLDGFSDRSEVKLGTDPNDAASFPHPELLAGLHSERAGNQVTATLSLLNTGLYDAYGVEAVMVAPDDSVSITNNTVGGSGRVRALKQVIVGSRLALPSPLPAAWTQANHAAPGVGGYYTGSSDHTYTFTVNCPNPGGCSVGQGAWSMAWSDGAGNSGSLNFGAGYNSPTFQPVGALGVTLALYSGNVANGESFTVAATTPRDTFQYTVNREPHTEPLVIVSYNDPQGNHRFVVPPAAMNLSAPTVDLHQFAGQMLPNVGVEIVTAAPFDSSLITHHASLLVNNPSDKTLTNAHLFLEAINISGTVVAEIPTQVTLPPGPKATAVTVDTSKFNPPYNASQDYIIMAFLTDYQGNILDTAGRPLSSFQVDPLPKLAADDASLTWNFGAVAQGTLLKHALALANTGFGRLYTYVPPASGLTLSGGGQTIGAADLLASELTLRTADLPIGGYDQTITIATSDPTAPARTLHVLGTITAPSGDTPGGAVQRPLDVPVTVTGSHSQGEWYNFTNPLGPDPQSLHPVKVYSQDNATLFGVGKYATNFGQGTASADIFGDGRDGDIAVSAGQTSYVPTWMPFNGSPLSANAAAGQSVIPLIRTSDFEVGQEILIYQTQGTSGSGIYEFGIIASIDSNILTLKQNLQHSYFQGGDCSQIGNCFRAQVRVVPHYRNVTVANNGVLTCRGWRYGIAEDAGGTCAFRISGKLMVESGGLIQAKGLGFYEGQARGYATTITAASYDHGIIDQGYGCPYALSGDGGSSRGTTSKGGGGAGHATRGQDGSGSACGGQGGNIYGTESLIPTLYLGSGGGASSWAWGGDGGGAVMIFAHELVANGLIKADGTDGGTTAWCNPGGSGACGKDGAGGGSGGSILIIAQNVALGNGNVTALGGGGGVAYPGGYNGGTGSVGRIAVQYQYLSGETNPVAYKTQRQFYSIEQIETAPYTNARLNLPEVVNGAATYNVQFGRKLDFAAAGNQLTQLRVPAGMVSSAKLDLLASGLAASTNVSLDIGDDGAVDWSGTVANNSTTTSPELAQAFNAYWSSHGAAATGTLDVPILVTSGGVAQLLLTNLQLQSAASSLRSVRLSAQNYTKFLLDFTVGTSGSVVAALDIGDNGSIDWISPAAGTAPMRWQTGDLKTALNSYLTGKSGIVDAPIRFYVSPLGAVKLNDYTATAAAQTDLVADGITLGASAVQAAATNYNEGDTVPVQATLRNAGATDSGPVTAAFFANAPGWGDWYIGSALLTNIPAGGSAPVSAQWNTTGFGSDQPVAVKVVVNPYNRLSETNVANNSKSVNATVTPTQVEQTITFAALPDRLLTAAPFTLNATSSSGLAIAFVSTTPTICTVNGNTVTLTKLVGVCTIQATQVGNLFYKAAPTVERSFVVNDPGKANQTITFDPLANKLLGDAPFTVNATASSGLAVSLATLTPNVCTVNGNTVTLLAAGVCTVRATQAGDSTHNPASPVDQNFTVTQPATKQDQTITFGPLADKMFGDTPFTVNATASSALPVSFTAAPPEVCTVNGNTVTLVAAGECSLTASQAGDATFNAAPSVTQKFLVRQQSSQSSVFLPLVRR